LTYPVADALEESQGFLVALSCRLILGKHSMHIAQTLDAVGLTYTSGRRSGRESRLLGSALVRLILAKHPMHITQALDARWLDLPGRRALWKRVKASW
jgi:hypothetical protein